MDDDNIASAFLEFNVHIGRLNKELAERNRLDKAAAPVYARLVMTGSANGNGILVLNLGGPDNGTTWHVRGLQVGGLATTTAAAGRADVFVSASDYKQLVINNMTQAGVQDWRDQASTLPLVANYGADTLVLTYPEKLQVIFSNATPFQQLVASAQVVSYQDAALNQEYVR